MFLYNITIYIYLLNITIDNKKLKCYYIYSNTLICHEIIKLFKLAGESPLSQCFPLLKTSHCDVFNSPFFGALLRHLRLRARGRKVSRSAERDQGLCPVDLAALKGWRTFFAAASSPFVSITICIALKVILCRHVVSQVTE